MHTAIFRAAAAGTIAILGLAACSVNTAPPTVAANPNPPVVVQTQPPSPPAGSVVVTPKAY